MSGNVVTSNLITAAAVSQPHEQIMFEDPRFVASKFLTAWDSRVSTLPTMQQEYDMKRLYIDDMWCTLSPKTKVMLLDYFDRRIQRLSRELILHRAVRTVLTHSAEIDEELYLQERQKQLTRRG